MFCVENGEVTEICPKLTGLSVPGKQVWRALTLRICRNFIINFIIITVRYGKTDTK